MSFSCRLPPHPKRHRERLCEAYNLLSVLAPRAFQPLFRPASSDGSRLASVGPASKKKSAEADSIFFLSSVVAGGPFLDGFCCVHDTSFPLFFPRRAAVRPSRDSDITESEPSSIGTNASMRSKVRRNAIAAYRLSVAKARRPINGATQWLFFGKSPAAVSLFR